MKSLRISSKTDLPDLTIFTDEKGRLCQAWKGKSYPENKDGYFGYLHRAVWEFYNGKIPKGYHIHHKDENKKNNQIENLECLTKHDHNSLHKKEQAAKGLLYSQSEKGRIEGRLRGLRSVAEGTLFFTTEEGRSVSSEVMKKWHSDPSNKELLRERNSNRYKDPEYKNKMSERMKLLNESQPIRTIECSWCKNSFETKILRPVSFCSRNCRLASWRKSKKN